MYMDDIKLFAKSEKELQTLIQTVRTYNKDTKMEFGIEKCTILVMKSGKRCITDGMELPNQEKLRTLLEKGTYKYLGILEADNIKQVEMKERNLKKSISEEPENYSRQNFIAGTLSKRLISELYPSQDTRDQRRTQTNWPENKKTNVHAWGLASRRWRWLSRREGWRGFTNIEDSVEASI